MKQQVNLLAPMFRKQRALFGARITLGILGLVAGVLALIYLATAWRGVALASEQQQLEARRTTVTKQLDELSAQIKGGGKNAELVAELTQLQTERKRKLSALEALSRRELGNTAGFSPQFIGLARQRIGGLWLTRIELTNGGQQMALQGITRSEELVPRYLKLLGAEPVFSGTEFEHAALQREGEAQAQMKFELRTRLKLPRKSADTPPVGDSQAPAGSKP